MAVVGELSVKLTAKVAAFQKAMGSASKKLDQFGDKAAAVSKKSGIAFAAMGAAMAVVARASNTQRQAEMKLTAAIKGTNAAIDPDKLLALASALERVTTTGDETTIENMALMVSLKMTEEQIAKLTPRILDVAQMLGKDARDATLAFGRALRGDWGPLDELNMRLTEAELKAMEFATAEEKVNMLLNKSAFAFGAAADATKTAVGAFGQLTNGLGGILEQFGSIVDADLGAVFGRVTNGLERVSNAVKTLDPEMKKLGSKVLVIAGLLTGGGSIAFGLTAIALKSGETVRALGDIGKAFGRVMLKSMKFLAVLLGIVAGIGAIATLTDALGWSGGDDDKKRGAAPGGAPRRVPYGMLGAKKQTDEIKKAIKDGWAKIDINKAFGESLKRGAELIGIDKLIEGMVDALGKFDKLTDEVDDTTKSLKDLNKKVKEAAKGPDRPKPVYTRARVEFLGGPVTYGEEPEPFKTPTGEEMGVESRTTGERFAGQASGGGPAGQLVGALQANTEHLGNFIGAVQQGFQAGGVGGAIGGGMVSLATSTDRFGEQMKLVDLGMKKLIGVFEPFMRHLDGIAVVVFDVISVIAEALAPILEIFGIILETTLVYPLRILGGVIAGLGFVIGIVVNAILDVGIFLLKKVNWIFKKLKMGGPLGDWIESMEGAKMDTDAMKQMAEDLLDLTKPLHDVVDAMKEVDESAREAAESMLNVPTGFKTALRRFESTELSGFEPGTSIQEDVTVDQTLIHVDQMNVTVGEVEEFVETIADAMESANFQQNGAGGSSQDTITGIPTSGFAT